MRSRAEAAPAFLWVEALAAPGERMSLGAEDAHYLTRVCRARPGEHVSLTDGRGAKARAELVEAGRSAVLQVLELDRVSAERDACLICGPPERGRADWMVEK